MLNSRSPSIWRDVYESVKSDPPSACQLLRNDESRRTDREIDDFASPEKFAFPARLRKCVFRGFTGEVREWVGGAE